MATHFSILAWRIPGTGKPSGLLSGVAQSRTRLKRLSSSSKMYMTIEKVKNLILEEGYLDIYQISRLFIN